MFNVDKIANKHYFLTDNSNQAHFHFSGIGMDESLKLVKSADFTTIVAGIIIIIIIILVFYENGGQEQKYLHKNCFFSPLK